MRLKKKIEILKIDQVLVEVRDIKMVVIKMWKSWTRQ